MTQPKRLLVGIVLGSSLGLAANAWSNRAPWLLHVVTYGTDPIGKIFIRLLLMLVVPLAFSALVLGVAELEPRRLGRLGMKTLGYTLGVSAIAVGIGLALVNWLKPGVGFPEHLRQSVSATAAPVLLPKASSPMELLIAVVPSNPIAAAANGDMLGFLVFALAFGVAMASVRTEAAQKLKQAIEGLFDVSMRLIELILCLAPIGIGALLFSMTARVGASLAGHLGSYVLVVVLGLAIHLFLVYSAGLYWLAHVSPIWFFRRIRLVLTTAFSTASSNATLPTALRVAEHELGLKPDISRFVLTAGASMNQNGTALFEGVTVLFLAQAFGVTLSLAQQAFVMAISVLAGMGTAGVPAGSLPVIATILALLQVPAEAVGLILGVDRLLDMCRTTVNVAGDLVLATIVGRPDSGFDGDHELDPSSGGEATPDSAAPIRAQL
ncbi:MAG TPA: dicarboxylate/amino acid:cation symporter [Polyangiaceae bacterium]|nr:dicarboxylate/amino acid:cation symporter [Polyangiaceae bacterium]